MVIDKAAKLWSNNRIINSQFYFFLGIDTISAQLLCASKSLGVDFRRTLTLGRQCLYPWLLDEKALQQVFEVQHIHLNAHEFIGQNWYAEPFFSLLGASQVDSLDVSSYEQATLLHDLNLPIPADLRQRFSVVFDGGMIEHVCNVPQALKNSMEMVEVGGHFLECVVANNFLGHGFWQFSPELPFRVFSPANGFEIVAVFLKDTTPTIPWYIVSDPDQVRSRVELCNTAPTVMCVLAKRVAEKEIFSRPPLQSDYVTVWKESNEPAPVSQRVSEPSISYAALRQRLPSSFKQTIRATLDSLQTLQTTLKTTITQPSRRTPFATPSFEESYYRSLSLHDFLHGRLNPTALDQHSVS